MFNGRYGNALTVILVIVIIIIIGLVGWFAYDMYKQSSTNSVAQSATDEFEDIVRKKIEDNKTTEGNGQFGTSNTVTAVTSANKKTYLEKYEVKGIIEIPKIGIKYPVLAEVEQRSLELSVAILYGPGLNEVGNTVILGHNYKNGLFFSNNDKLKNGDEIYITDQSGTKITYIIYNIYVTDPNDAEYMLRDTGNTREISLSTCTDNANERLVIWAKEKENKKVEETQTNQ